MPKFHHTQPNSHRQYIIALCSYHIAHKVSKAGWCRL